MSPIIINFLIPLAGTVGMIFVGILAWWVIKQDSGTARMREIAAFIQEGANAFLRREFQTIAYFIAGIAVLLLIFLQWQIAFGFGPTCAPPTRPGLRLVEP
jgi:K(+)-stimulated pyrophosphate-energized sodium pump